LFYVLTRTLERKKHFVNRFSYELKYDIIPFTLADFIFENNVFINRQLLNLKKL